MTFKKNMYFMVVVIMVVAGLACLIWFQKSRHDTLTDETLSLAAGGS